MSPSGLFAAGSSLRGIACMLFSGIFLTANDSITKWLVPHYPVGEILFLQGCLIALLVAAWMGVRGENPFRVVRFKLHLFRGLMYATGSFAFVYALRYLPLAEVIAIAFAGPLFQRLLAEPAVGEVRRTGALVGHHAGAQRRLGRAGGCRRGADRLDRLSPAFRAPRRGGQ